MHDAEDCLSYQASPVRRLMRELQYVLRRREGMAWEIVGDHLQLTVWDDIRS